MKSLHIKWLSCNFAFLLLFGCNKDFLDKKPNTNIVVPETIEDMTGLLDNQAVMMYNSPASPILSADEYYYSSIDNFNTAGTKAEKNWYLWNKDIYQGENNIRDWNAPYQAVFYANVVLSNWDKLLDKDKLSEKGKYVKGWALFARSYNFFNLVQTFAQPYDSKTSETDLGIPLKITADINEIKPRATVQECYDRIIRDTNTSLTYFPNTISTLNNRPSKCAAYALLARIYLNMRNYEMAALNATKCLSLYNTLIDYNTININASRPFSIYNIELLYSNITNVGIYGALVVNSGPSMIDTNLISFYDDQDLRKVIYFKNNLGAYFIKSGYNGIGGYPFTGLAVDEIYLIEAESLARTSRLTEAVSSLNKLLVNRYKEGTFIPFASNDKNIILNKVLNERRKELVWRGLRWYDIIRLNKDGANITLRRSLGGKTYSLPPNDPRYIMPIPDDEIALSHIQQNIR